MASAECPCGCGKPYDQAVKDVMRTSLVNRDQAEAWIDDAAQRRAGREGEA